MRARRPNPWLEFNNICLEAEEVRKAAVEVASAERNLFVEEKLPNWTCPVSDRVREAAALRCDRKVKAAKDAYEDICSRAREELFKALGD